MPFFYSQSLAKAEGAKADPRRALSAGGSRTKTSITSHTAATGGRRPGKPRFVWHSGTGSSGKRVPTPKYRRKGKKVVHFSTIEVQPFHFDWSLADDVFYTREELTAMGKTRFDDAATLRQHRRRAEAEKESKAEAKKKKEDQCVDDLNLSKRTKVLTVATLLSQALNFADTNENASIRGIEHFVYPELQQEMIRRKKEVQREVLGFVRSKQPDPQGWRLANYSRSFTQWARDLALEKGMKYCMNNAAEDPDVVISEDELNRCKKSVDEIEGHSHVLRGSSSFSATGKRNMLKEIGVDPVTKGGGANESWDLKKTGEKRATKGEGANESWDLKRTGEQLAGAGTLED